MSHGTPADHRHLEVRPLERTDAAQVLALFGRLSADSRYLRYLTPVHQLSGPMLERLTSVDHDRHEAVGAFLDGDLVGAAHWFRGTGEQVSAEIAVEVADGHQRHGLGRLLLQELGARARARGIARFTALAWSDNSGVRALVQHGDWPAAVTVDGAEMQIELALTA